MAKALGLSSNDPFYYTSLNTQIDVDLILCIDAWAQTYTIDSAISIDENYLNPFTLNTAPWTN